MSRTRTPKKIRFDEPVDAGVPAPDRRVGALEAVADDHVRGRPRPASRSVSRPTSATLNWRSPSMKAIEPVARGPEAGPQRGAVAEVRGVVDDAEDVRMLGRQLVGDGRRPVARAVVHGDDLELLGQRRQRRQRLVDQGLEVGLFVVGREEEGQLGDPASRPAPDSAAVPSDPRLTLTGFPFDRATWSIGSDARPAQAVIRLACRIVGARVRLMPSTSRRRRRGSVKTGPYYPENLSKTS